MYGRIKENERSLAHPKNRSVGSAVHAGARK